MLTQMAEQCKALQTQSLLGVGIGGVVFGDSLLKNFMVMSSVK
jgi:hypothetical protein